MFEEMWGKLWCPAKGCDAVNWICHGDLDDVTDVDVEAVVCWRCKNKFLRVDRESLMDMYGDELKENQTLEDYIFAEQGRETPD